jgi:hypothetical protein
VEIIALVLSGLALAVSLLAVWHAKRSADAAVAAERHERRPRLDVELVGHSSSLPVWRITNRGPVDLDSLVVTPPLAEVDGVRITHGLHTEAGNVARLDLGPLAISASATVRLLIAEEGQGKTLTLPMIAGAGKDRWPVPAVVALPSDPSMYIL